MATRPGALSATWSHGSSLHSKLRAESVHACALMPAGHCVKNTVRFRGALRGRGSSKFGPRRIHAECVGAC